MKNLKWKKVGSAVLATALAGSMVLPATAYAQGEIVQLEGGTSTQTNTAPEQVFLNKYSGTVRTQNFNDNWKFYLGDASGAQTPAFDDSSWDQVNLPHDYSIDQKYNRSMDGESGYLPGGTGWYRKSFTVDKSLEGKRISIDFGGVYMNATIYVNGKKLGTHPYGYTPFSFDITDNVKFGKENVIAVKVDHQTPSSRFYSGSGIYRDVDFVVTETAFNELATMVTEDKVTDLEGLTGGADMEGYQQLYAGRNMIVPRGPWTISEGEQSFGLKLGTDFDYAAMPQYGNNQKFASENGWSLAVSSSCKEQEIALKFLEYLYQDDVMLEHNIRCTQIPAKKSLAQSEEYKKEVPYADVLVGILDQGQFIGNFNTDRLKETINNTFVSYCSGEYGSLDEAMEDMNTKLNGILE